MLNRDEPHPPFQTLDAMRSATIVDQLTGELRTPPRPPVIVEEPQPTECRIHLEGVGVPAGQPCREEIYDATYRIVPVRAWLVSTWPDRLQIDPIIAVPDGEGWQIADLERMPNLVAFDHPWRHEVHGDGDPLPDAADARAWDRWDLKITARETRALYRHLVADCGYRDAGA
jgi:hypothetical protein